MHSLPLSAIIIAIVASKGGAGKTTLAANLGGYFADLGFNTLLVDADAQPALSSYYPIDYKAENGLTHLFHSATATDAISRTAYENLDLIYSDDPGSALENFVLHTPDGRGRLKFALDDVHDQYDVIIIDTVGARITMPQAAVAAADLLISPIPPDLISAKEFRRGTLGLLKEMRPMERMGLPIGPLLALIYRMDRTNDAKMIADEIRKVTPTGDYHLLNTVVPHTAAYKHAATQQRPVHCVEKSRKGPTPSGLQTMKSLAEEIMDFARTELNIEISPSRKTTAPAVAGSNS